MKVPNLKLQVKTAEFLFLNKMSSENSLKSTKKRGFGSFLFKVWIVGKIKQNSKDNKIYKLLYINNVRTEK